MTAKMWKRPPRREFKPKPTSPGQPITWTRSTGGCWSGGHYEPSATVTRTGTIWSEGALPNSAWVQPDAAPAGDMAMVMLKNMTENPCYPVSWQHDTMHRVGHLRASGGMLAEFVTRTHYRYGKGEVEYQDTVGYHCDPECPEIEHETRPCTAYELSVRSVMGMLLDASARGRSDLCRRCVYLSEPAEVYEDEPLAVAA